MKEPLPLVSFQDDGLRTEFVRRVERIVAASHRSVVRPYEVDRNVADFFDNLPASTDTVEGWTPVGMSSDPRQLLLSWSQMWGLVRWMDEFASDLSGAGNEWGTSSMMDVVVLRLSSEYGISPFVLPLADGSWEARLEHHYGRFGLGRDGQAIRNRLERLCESIASKISQDPSLELGVSDLMTRFLTLSRTVDTCDEFAQTDDMEELIRDSGDQIQSLLWWAARVVLNRPGSKMEWDAYPWPWEV